MFDSLKPKTYGPSASSLNGVEDEHTASTPRLLALLVTPFLVVGATGLAMTMGLGPSLLPEPLAETFFFVFLVIPSVFVPPGLRQPVGHLPFLTSSGVVLLYLLPGSILLAASIILAVKRGHGKRLTEEPEDSP